MLKDIVFAQKLEKERLLSFSYIERNKISEAQKWLDSDLIKVILGPRRAGKSVFALMLLKDRPFMYFNFDDERILSNQSLDTDALMQEMLAVYGPIKTIFFDEIQNLPRWEIFVNRLQREGYNLILTGSNANLLSRELATALTGRHIPIEIFPFDFLEFLRAKQVEFNSKTPLSQNAILCLEQYLNQGGYPEIVTKNLDLSSYLEILFDSLLFKDVVRRHRIKFSEQISDLAAYLLDNAANLYGLRRLARLLKFKSEVTLDKYLNYLAEAYLIFCVKQYSPKTAVRARSPRKIFVVDNGFIAAKSVKHSPNNGQLMENLVFDELVKNGYSPNKELFYYKTRNGREIDLVVKNGYKINELIQVCWDIQDETVRKREIKGLLEGAGELVCNNLKIITWNEEKIEEKNGKKIELTPLSKWITNIPKK